MKSIVEREKFWTVKTATYKHFYFMSYQCLKIINTNQLPTLTSCFQASNECNVYHRLDDPYFDTATCQ